MTSLVSASKDLQAGERLILIDLGTTLGEKKLEGKARYISLLLRNCFVAPRGITNIHQVCREALKILLQSKAEKFFLIFSPPFIFLRQWLSSSQNTGRYANVLISHCSCWHILLFLWQMLKGHKTLLLQVMTLWKGLPSGKERKTRMWWPCCGMSCAQASTYESISRSKWPGRRMRSSDQNAKTNNERKLDVENYTFCNYLPWILCMKKKYIGRNWISHSSSLVKAKIGPIVQLHYCKYSRQVIFWGLHGVFEKKCCFKAHGWSFLQNNCYLEYSVLEGPCWNILLIVCLI